jgi:hypothetical protein
MLNMLKMLNMYGLRLVLPCSHDLVLPCCHVAMLPCCHVATLPCCQGLCSKFSSTSRSSSTLASGYISLLIPLLISLLPAPPSAARCAWRGCLYAGVGCLYGGVGIATCLVECHGNVCDGTNMAHKGGITAVCDATLCRNVMATFAPANV